MTGLLSVRGGFILIITSPMPSTIICFAGGLFSYTFSFIYLFFGGTGVRTQDFSDCKAGALPLV
jgi:hypothetical protein